MASVAAIFRASCARWKSPHRANIRRECAPPFLFSGKNYFVACTLQAALLLHLFLPGASRRDFREAKMDARAAPRRLLPRHRPENNFAKWLTSEKHVISFRPADTPLRKRVITNRPTTRATTKTSAQDVVTVDTGFVSLEKRISTLLCASPFRARIDHGPGVFIRGAHAPQPDLRRRFGAAPVRHGNPPVAVPL